MSIFLESPADLDLDGVESHVLGQSSELASPVQFIKEYIEQTLNTPPGPAIGVVVLHYKRQRLIQEIVESEAEYVHALGILQNCFLDVLAINDYMPMKMLNSVVARIRARHAIFSRQLSQLVESRVKRFDDSSEMRWDDQNLWSWDQLELCQQLAQLIAGDVVQIEQYRNYFYHYNQISDMLSHMSLTGQDGLLFAILLKIELCLPKYYMQTSARGYKRDFSFRAMTQFPINRVAKYRLFLESMVLLTERPSATDIQRLGEAECQDLASKIKTSLENMHQILLRIDEPKCDDRKDPILCLVQMRLNFPFPEERIPVEAMGHCYLRGCLAVVWPVGENPIFSTNSHRRSRYFNNFHRHKKSVQLFHEQLGAFLFKSYLVLATVSLPTAQYPYPNWTIKFALRLANCKLITSLSNDYGLQTAHKFSLKIQFEYDFKIWEVLLVCRKETEYTIWQRELDLFINVVHGPHQFGNSSDVDMSQSTLESTLHFSDSTTFPEQMVPWVAYDEHLSGRLDRTRSINRRERRTNDPCYSCQNVNVEVVYKELGEGVLPPTTWSLKSGRSDPKTEYNLSIAAVRAVQRTVYQDYLGKGLISPLDDKPQTIFHAEITSVERVQVEMCMQDVWSEIIPRITADMPWLLTKPNGVLGADGTVIHGIGSDIAWGNSTDGLYTSPVTNAGNPGSCTVPAKTPTIRSTRWSIKRVFSRRASTKTLANVP